MMNIDWIRQAKIDIDDLVDDLQESNNGCTDLEHMVLLDLIESARKLKDKIYQFANAVQ